MVTSTGTLLEGSTTVLEAHQFAIKSVKLFSSSTGPFGAEVTRTFPLSFLRSQDEPQVVEVIHLPASHQSLHVSVTSASGNVSILDHYHFSEVCDSEKNSSQTLRELQAERARLQDELRLRQQGLKFLTTYMDSLAQCKSQAQTEATQMVSFLSEFVEIGITRSAVVAELADKVAGLDNQITEETNRLSKLSKDLPLKVVTILSCKSQAPVEAAELTVSYVVASVSWQPEYDLHISMAGITPSPAVKLDFRCSVTQWTGENWDNVNLALTTADQVSQLIQVPEPKRIDIRLSPPAPVFPTMRGGAGLFGSSTFGSSTSFGGSKLFGQPSSSTPVAPAFAAADVQTSVFGQPATLLMSRVSEPPSPGLVPVAPAPTIEETREMAASSQTISQLTSHSGKDPITHIANGSIFIPSDRAAHHVLVTSLSLHAEFMRVVVPSVDTRVYYTCEVKNTSDYVLLPGTVKAYLNDKHVSSVDIRTTELPQILECSLAVDTDVKTIHNRAPEALPSVGGFTGKATTTYTSATVIHNTHAEPIRGVIVRSAIPLPADPRITVVLKEPAGLANIDEGSVTVKEGCLARWSTTGGRKGKQAGMFEWVCDVDPGTEMVKAVWEVCAPQDLKLVEQVQS